MLWDFPPKLHPAGLEEAESRSVTHRRAGISKHEASEEPRVLAAILSLVLPTLPHLAIFYLSDALL